MAGILDGLDPQTALLLGLSSGLLGTAGQGRRATFGEALGAGLQSGMGGYRAAVQDRRQLEQMQAQREVQQQQMRLAQEAAAREQQTFDLRMSEAQRQRQEQARLAELAQQFAKSPAQMAMEQGAQAGSVGPTNANAERLAAAPGATGYDFAGYADALASVDPMRSLQLKQALQKETPVGVVVPEGASLNDPRSGKQLFVNPKATPQTDAGKKLAELKALGYSDEVAQGIAYGMLEVVPDGNGGTAIVHKANALAGLGGRVSPTAQPAPMPGLQPPAQPTPTPGLPPPMGGSATPARGPFDAPPPLPGQIGGTPGSNNVRDRIKAEESFRKEWASQPAVKKYGEGYQAYRNVIEASQRDNPQADISLVYGVAKLYDPESVVREGEYATIANSQSIPEKIKGLANYVMGGGRLTAETKAQLRREARSRHDVMRAEYDSASSQFRDIAQRSGLKPENVLTEVGPRRLSRAEFDAVVRSSFKLGKNKAAVIEALRDQGHSIPNDWAN